jgi:hypothetical protein
MRLKLLCVNAGLFLALVFSACQGLPASEPVEKNYDAGSITLTNLPLAVKGQPAYKVYVYIADSDSSSDAPKAQGTALLDGSAGITVQLYKPPEDYRGKDPDEHGEAWSGTGRYFSVIISPRNAPDKDAILVRGGMTFDRISQQCDFKSLMSVSESPLFAGRTAAIYNGIIRADRQGIGSDIVTP